MQQNLQAIVLVDENWGIGYEGKQHIFIPEDLARFKAMTQNTNVVYGRKTLATFPKGKPLPQRGNFILSRQANFTQEGAQVFGDIPSLLQALPPQETVFVIGGASVYQALLPHCQTIYVTKVQASFPVDCFFPNLDLDPQWKSEAPSAPGEHENIKFTYQTYHKES